MLIFSAPSQAARVSGLYSTEVVVVNQSDGERQRGFQLAMEDVLIKLTGDSAILVRAEAAPIIRRAGKFVEEYRYAPIVPSTEEEPVEKNNSGPAYQLYVRFSSTLLGAELRNQNIPVWGRERPSIIVWLAVENATSRMLVSSATESDERAELANQAQRRAIPLVLPVMDKADRRALSYGDIRGGFIDKIKSASERYRSAVVLTGHMSQQRGRWHTSWQLIDGDNVQTWQALGDDLTTAIGTGLEGVSNRLVLKYASGQHIAESTIAVRVNRILTLENYANVMKYFSSLSVVTGVHVSQMSTDNTIFRLSLSGSKEDLQRIIALDPKLQPISAEDEPTVIGAADKWPVISYTLVR